MILDAWIKKYGCLNAEFWRKTYRWLHWNLEFVIFLSSRCISGITSCVHQQTRQNNQHKIISFGKQAILCVSQRYRHRYWIWDWSCFLQYFVLIQHNVPLASSEIPDFKANCKMVFIKWKELVSDNVPYHCYLVYIKKSSIWRTWWPRNCNYGYWK